jgi:hypothetical protein
MQKAFVWYPYISHVQNVLLTFRVTADFMQEGSRGQRFRWHATNVPSNLVIFISLWAPGKRLIKGWLWILNCGELKGSGWEKSLQHQSTQLPNSERRPFECKSDHVLRNTKLSVVLIRMCHKDHHSILVFVSQNSQCCIPSLTTSSVPLNTLTLQFTPSLLHEIRGCIQKFPDWPPGARTANGTALCH